MVVAVGGPLAILSLLSEPGNHLALERLTNGTQFPVDVSSLAFQDPLELSLGMSDDLFDGPGPLMENERHRSFMALLKFKWVAGHEG
jgi:hypothetical protein